MSLRPVATTYPGVYVVEEDPAVRTIAGVATSITAFVGRALRGPTDKPVLVSSFADFERVYGGLWAESHLGYSVQDFFNLGGGAAVIVRVHKTRAGDVAKLSIGAAASQLRLVAASPGAWGGKLTAVSDRQTANNADSTLFNLRVTDTGSGVVETFRNISFAAASPRRADVVLANGSSLVRVDGALPTAAQAAMGDTASGATAGGTNDGNPITAAEIATGPGMAVNKRGLYALDYADLINLLIIPPYAGAGDLGQYDVDTAVIDAALAYTVKRRAVMVLDPPTAWSTVALAVAGAAAAPFDRGTNSAVYFPRITKPDNLRDGQIMTFAPSGAVAGVIAATDASRGVWKSPAGLDATLRGVSALAVPLNDDDIKQLNPIGVNCLRLAPGAGHVVWGARTREGADRLSSQWKYLAVRRTALFLEESLYRGLQWAVFEPNDEPLWAQIRLNVSSFMNNLFRQGAFKGSSTREAYFVKCDKDTTIQNDVDLGVVNIQVGFAPLKPAEFVILRLQQMAGQLSV